MDFGCLPPEGIRSTCRKGVRRVAVALTAGRGGKWNPPGQDTPCSIPCASHLLGEFENREVGAGIKDNVLEEGLFTPIPENS